MRWPFRRRARAEEPPDFPPAVQVGEKRLRPGDDPRDLYGHGTAKKIPDEKGHAEAAIGVEREGVRSHTGEYQ